MRSAYFVPELLLKAAKKTITDDELKEGLRLVRRIYRKNGEDDDAAKGTDMATDLDKNLIKKYSPPNKTVKKT
jgi:hypothetical protein